MQAVLVATILNGDYSSTFANGSGTSRAKVCECRSSDSGICMRFSAFADLYAGHEDLVIILIVVAVLSVFRLVLSTAYVIDGCELV